MLFNQTIEYAFRAMACLAIHYGDGPVRSKDLAERANVPAFYLSKIMRRIVLAGLAHSKRGHGGGFQLTRPPEEISFLDVLEAVDYQAEQGRCAFGLGSCNSTKPCPMHDAWSTLQGSFLQWARSNHLSRMSDGTCDTP